MRVLRTATFLQRNVHEICIMEIQEHQKYNSLHYYNAYNYIAIIISYSEVRTKTTANPMCMNPHKALECTLVHKNNHFLTLLYYYRNFNSYTLFLSFQFYIQRFPTT